MKDKVGPVAAESADSFGEAVAAGGSGAVAEAIEALASLGYSNSEIMPVIKKSRRGGQDERGNIEAGLKADDEVISRR